MKLTIEKRQDLPEGRTGKLAYDYKYFLDDMEITDGLTGLRLSMGVGEANVADLQIMLDDINVEADALAALKTHMEEKQRVDAELLSETDVSWWFLSFADGDKAEGSQHLGGAWVKATSMPHAITVSHLTGCNPGGEVQVAGPIKKIIPPEYQFKILTKEEIENMPEPEDEVLDAEIVEEDPPDVQP